MNQHVADRKSVNRAFLVTFTGVVTMGTIIDPNALLFQATLLAFLAAVFVAALTGLYLDFLDHLDRALTERRSRRMAALAIDD